MLPERRVRLVLVAFWIIPALVGVLGFQLVPSRLDPNASLFTIVVSQLGMWGTWGIWTLVGWSVGERFPIERPHLARNIGIHALVGSLIVLVQILLQSTVSAAAGLSEPRGLVSTIVIGIRSYGDTFVVLYCAIVLAHMAYRWYANWQSQRQLAAQMSEDLAQAQLRALQAQLNPHFLFNALNSVVTLIGRDPPQAQRTVVRLAELLRATLHSGSAQEIPLSQELDVTRRYLDIEQVRFADRLSVVWCLDTPFDSMVPTFALQPLVENALLHGIAPRAAPGEIVVTTSHHDGSVVLRVSDNGVGLTNSPKTRGAGVGLENLRTRLLRLYGAAASLTLEPKPGGGTDAELRVPIRPLVAT